MHRSPADPYAAPIRASTAWSRSASGITMAWFFALHRACARLPWAVAVRCTCSPTALDPTKLTAETFGCEANSSTASLSPFTTFRTPGGSPASENSSASRNGQEGSFSEGFRMKVLPQAMATGNIHIGTIAGKLNGVTPTHTPSGCRKE